MIRQAVMEDKGRCVELLRDSRVGAGFDKPDGISGFVFPFDAGYAERFFMQHLLAKNCTVIIHDVDGIAQGILTAVAFEHPYGPVRLAKESMWWIDPAHRGGTTAIRMLDVFEVWAKAQGCAYSGVAGMGADPAVSKLYERRGYHAAELHFLKEL